MLKHRLIFGTLMTIIFVGLVLFDGWLDGSISAEKTNASLQGTILVAFLVLIAIPANLELAKLISTTGAKVFLPITICVSVLLAGLWYWAQFFENSYKFASLFLAFVLCFGFLAIFLWQAVKYAFSNTYSNCGANLLVIIYLGALTSFVVAVRIDFGPIAFLMYIFTVKCSDIGAYTLGRLFGRHKFSPVLSPKKTWEGMAGACLFAAVVASIFAGVFDIMLPWQAILFGVIFAFLGQLGDLAESMLKRAAEQKDSADSVPGFGGILDVIDSPLATAGFAYLFFMLI